MPNAKVLLWAFIFMLVCIGLAALAVAFRAIGHEWREWRAARRESDRFAVKPVRELRR